jgi:hypothetical protein
MPLDLPRRSRAIPLRNTVSAALVALSVVACNDTTGPDSRGVRLLTPIAADTANSEFPVEIQVNDASGQPLRNAEVKITPVMRPAACATCPAQPSLTVRPEGGGAWSAGVTDTTDADARVRAQVRLGHLAGAAGLVVEVPSKGLVDTLPLKITPGAAHSVQLFPEDTAVQVGRQYTVRATVVDRAGNPRTDAVTLSTSSGDAEVSGMTVKGVAFGEVQVRATAGTATGTASLSLLPAGRLAVTRLDFATGSSATVLVNTDGSEAQVLASAPLAGVAGWTRDGSHLVMLYNELDRVDRLYLYNVQAGTTRLVLDAGSNGRVVQFASPSITPDEQRIYFTGYPSPWGYSLLWSVAADGTGLQQHTQEDGPYMEVRHVSLSPDGALLAYTGRRGQQDGSGALYTFNVASGAHTRVLPNWGTNARWSPTGQWIAFIGDYSRVNLVRPDGTGLRQLLGVEGFPEWSADGRWLLVQMYGRWKMVEAATGEIVPIPDSIAGGWRFAAWRP